MVLVELNEYTNKKESLLKNLQRLQIIADDLGLTNQTKEIEKNIIQLNHEHFELVVVGEFSRGKSTFINAMLGRRILPSSKKPTTTMISKIVYSEEPSYSLFYKSGKVKKLDEKTFISITASNVASKELPIDKFENLKSYLNIKGKEDLNKIDYAIVSYPLDFCKNNVEIIDTPGINDLSTSRVDITYRYLNKADAVIMVLAASQVLTQSEMEFIQERVLKNQITDIFFVINFKDQASPGEEQYVIDFAKKNLYELMRIIDSPLHIYLVSSKQALIYRRLENGERLNPITAQLKPENLSLTGFPDFEEALRKFLMNDKGNAKLKKYKKRGLANVMYLEKDIATRIEATKHSADDVREKIFKLQPVLDQSKRDANRAISTMKEDLICYRTELENLCIKNRNLIRTTLNKTIDEYDGEWDNKSISQSIVRLIEKKKVKLVESVQSFEEEKLQKNSERVERCLSEIWSSVDVHYQQSFCFSEASSENKDLSIDVSNICEVKSAADSRGAWGAVALGAMIGGAIGGAPLLPLIALAGGVSYIFGLFSDKDSKGSIRDRQKDALKKQLYKHYNKEYDEMTKKIMTQYDNMVDDYSKFICRKVDAQIDDMKNQLNQILIIKNMQEKDAEKEREKLQMALLELKAIKKELNLNEIQ